MVSPRSWIFYEMRYFVAILIVICSVLPGRVVAQWNVGQLLRIGTDAIYYDDNRRAIEHFNRVIRLKPHLYEPYFFRGYAKLGMDDINGAIADFTKAIDINPNYLQAYIYRGMAFFQVGRYEESLEDYRVAAELAPSDAMIYAYRGITYRALDLSDLAEKDYSKSIRLNPKQQFAYINRALIREERGDYKGAMEDCNAVLRQNIFSADAYAIRGYINKKEGRIHDAIEDFNRGIKAAPNNMQLRMNRALLHYEQKDFYDALADYDEMLEIDSSYVYALYNRALLRIELGATNDAIDDFSRLIELNPENIITYFNRGLAYQAIKDYESAYSDFSRCIALYPDFVKAYYARSSVLMDMNRHDEAFNDQYAAQEIMSRYRDMKLGVAGAFVDTTQNLTKLLDLNDKSSSVRDMVSGKTISMITSVRLKPLYRVTLLPADSVNTTTSDKYDIRIVRFNNSNPGTMALTIASQPLVRDVTILNPTTDAEYLLAGTAYLDSDDYMNAIGCFEKIGAESAWYTLALFNLANTRALMYMYIERHSGANTVLGEKRERRVDYSQVIEEYDASLKNNPDFIYALYNKATILAESGEVEKAIELLNSVLLAEPNFADAYYNRGVLHLYLGNRRSAIEDLGKAGELGIDEAYSVIKRYSSDV